MLEKISDIIVACSHFLVTEHVDTWKQKKLGSLTISYSTQSASFRIMQHRSQ